MLVGTIYYLIQPRDTLLNLLQNYQVLHFRSSVLWQQEEGGSRTPTAEEYSLTIKLVFMAQFRSDLLGLTHQNNQQLLDHMMGSPPFTVEVFDKWWNLERINRSLEFRDAIIRIDDSQFDLLASTGIDRVDHLINNVREQNRQDPRFNRIKDKITEWNRQKDDK